MMIILLESYLLMAYVCLHLTIFACDSACYPGISLMKTFFPPMVQIEALQILQYTGITISQAQIVAHVVTLGSMFVLLVSMGKIVGSVLNRFLAIFISLALSIWILQELKVI